MPIDFSIVHVHEWEKVSWINKYSITYTYIYVTKWMLLLYLDVLMFYLELWVVDFTQLLEFFALP